MTTAYTAKELNVDAGDRVVFMHEWNGWSWCELESTGECGWIPNECLRTE
ncbi:MULTISPECIES: SH3 domain-containing protein [Brevibacillus]|nr:MULTISPECIES: SH3 domain-containing protein [Brevibacillus]MED1943808.1 SH3 domain-containing protein [Brevibacillus formosus]MED1999820.1 SH3 domain-containing protein [Brevibacillus formosus]MED2082043.1 SH3 domain-containing protein [Brevibacillus formosus]